MEVRFYVSGEVADDQMRFAVIIAKFENQWVLCRHKKRVTWEFPGGTREQGEAIDETAKRELYEETGAILFEIERRFIYEANGTYGMVYSADIQEFAGLPESEIGEIAFFEDLNVEWTYPDIQPYLMRHYLKKTMLDSLGK